MKKISVLGGPYGNLNDENIPDELKTASLTDPSKYKAAIMATFRSGKCPFGTGVGAGPVYAMVKASAIVNHQLSNDILSPERLLVIPTWFEGEGEIDGKKKKISAIRLDFVLETVRSEGDK